MTANTVQRSSVERPVRPMSGYPLLLLVLAFFAGVVALIVKSGQALEARKRLLLDATVFGMHPAITLVVALVGIGAWVVLLCGFFVVQPNEARVLVFFGRYVGSVNATPASSSPTRSRRGTDRQPARAQLQQRRS
jgi:hypothetical protein